jgi:LAO/AO transport system kinase
MVDMVIVTKDDGDQQKIIQKAKHDYEQALHILRHEGWIPPVLSCSSVTKSGFPEILKNIDSYFFDQKQIIESKRNKQGIDWMWQLILDQLKDSFMAKVGTDSIRSLEQEILHKKLTSPEAASQLLKKFLT